MKPLQDATSVGFRTAALEVRIERSPLRIVVRDLAGTLISADAVGRPTKFQAGGFSVSQDHAFYDHHLGLGDKAVPSTSVTSQASENITLDSGIH